MEAIVQSAQSRQITLPANVCEALRIQKDQQYDARILEGGAVLLLPQSGRAVAAAMALREMLLAAGATPEAVQAELRRMREDDAV